MYFVRHDHRFSLTGCFQVLKFRLVSFYLEMTRFLSPSLHYFTKLQIKFPFRVLENTPKTPSSVILETGILTVLLDLVQCHHSEAVLSICLAFNPVWLLPESDSRLKNFSTLRNREYSPLQHLCHPNASVTFPRVPC